MNIALERRSVIVSRGVRRDRPQGVVRDIMARVNRFSRRDVPVARFCLNRPGMVAIIGAELGPIAGLPREALSVPEARLGTFARSCRRWCRGRRLS